MDLNLCFDKLYNLQNKHFKTITKTEVGTCPFLTTITILQMRKLRLKRDSITCPRCHTVSMNYVNKNKLEIWRCANSSSIHPKKRCIYSSTAYPL